MKIGEKVLRKRKVKEENQELIKEKPIVKLIIQTVCGLIIFCFVIIPTFVEREKYFKNAKKFNAEVTDVYQSNKEYVLTLQYNEYGHDKIQNGIIMSHKYKIGDKIEIYVNPKYPDEIRTKANKITYIEGTLLSIAGIISIIFISVIIYRIRYNYKNIYRKRKS